MKKFTSEFMGYSIANLKRLTFFYNQDFTINKKTPYFLRARRGYNLRLNIGFIRTSDTNQLENLLRTRLAITNRKRKALQQLKFIKELNSYRSNRHRRFLPARGQRTKTNAKTNRKKNKSNK